jgi:hypothetical protein
MTQKSWSVHLLSESTVKIRKALSRAEVVILCNTLQAPTQTSSITCYSRSSNFNPPHLASFTSLHLTLSHHHHPSNTDLPHSDKP